MPEGSNVRLAAPAGYAIEEAADYLGVSRRTIYNLLERGALEAYRVGSRRLITRDSIERYVRRHLEAGA